MWTWLARTQARNGDPEGSRASVLRALALDPMSAAARLHLADLHLQAGEEHRAAARLLEVARAGRSRPRVLRSVARRIPLLASAAVSVRVAEALGANGRGPKEVMHMSEEAPRPDVAPGEPRSTLEDCRSEVDARLQVEDVGAAWRILRPQELENEDLRRLHRIAHAFRRMGELTLAWEVVQRARLLAPGNTELRRTEEEVAQEVCVLSGRWPSELETSSSMPARQGTILHLTETSAPILWTRAALQLHLVARSQREAGFRVHVANVLGAPDAPPRDRARSYDDVEYHRLRLPQPVPAGMHDRLTASLQKARQLAELVRPAVVHVDAGYLTAILGRALGRMFSVPVLQEFRPFPSIATSQRARWREECMTGALQAADAVVVRSPSIAEEARARGVEHQRIHVVPLPALLEGAEPGGASGRSAPERDRARGAPIREPVTSSESRDVGEAYARILESLGARSTGLRPSPPSTRDDRERAGPFAP